MIQVGCNANNARRGSTGMTVTIVWSANIEKLGPRTYSARYVQPGGTRVQISLRVVSPAFQANIKTRLVKASVSCVTSKNSPMNLHSPRALRARSERSPTRKDLLCVSRAKLENLVPLAINAQRDGTAELRIV